VRQQIAKPLPARAVLLETKRRTRERNGALIARHASNT
jgi:hypothetical protein